MYTIQEAPVFQLLFDLMKDTHLARKKFPKTEKYTLGERIEENILEALLAIMEAGYAKKEWKLPHLDRARTNIESAKILFRLARELQLIDGKYYLAFEERLQRASQMLGGWKRSL